MEILSSISFRNQLKRKNDTIFFSICLSKDGILSLARAATGNLSFSFFFTLFVFSCLLPFISVHLISSYFILLFLFRYTLHISVYSVCYCIFLDVLFDSSVIYFLIFCFGAYFILLFISC